MIYTLALRYSKSIFTLAKEKTSLENYKNQLQSVGEIFQNSKKLQFILTSTQITTQKKLQVVKKIFSNKGLSKDVFNFLQLLAANNRFFIFNELLVLFDELYRKEKNSLVVCLTTNTPLSVKKKNKIKKALEDYFQCIVELQEKIDANILGGVIAQIGSYLIDASVRNFLTSIHNSIE